MPASSRCLVCDSLCAARDKAIGERHRKILKLLPRCRRRGYTSPAFVSSALSTSFDVSGTTSAPVLPCLHHISEFLPVAACGRDGVPASGARCWLTDARFSVVVSRPPPQTAIWQRMIRSLIDYVLRRHLHTAARHAHRLELWSSAACSTTRAHRTPRLEWEWGVLNRDATYNARLSAPVGQPRSFVTTLHYRLIWRLMHSDHPRDVDMAPISACLWPNSNYLFTTLLNYGTQIGCSKLSRPPTMWWNYWLITFSHSLRASCSFVLHFLSLFFLSSVFLFFQV